MPDRQILVDTPATLRATFYPDGSDNPQNDGAVEVEVTRADGSAVTGVGAVTAEGAGRYSATLPAQEDMDLLTATWTGDTTRVRTRHEIVGGFIVTLADIRATLNLNDGGKFPADRLDDARAWFTDLATNFLNYSPVPRFSVKSVSGNGSSTLPFRVAYARRLRFVTIDGTDAGDVSDWLFTDYLVRSTAGSFTDGARNVTIGYEHGRDAPPDELEAIALQAIRFRLLADRAGQINERALSIQNEFGNIQMAQASRGRPTGIPDVDSGLLRLRLPVLA